MLKMKTSMSAGFHSCFTESSKDILPCLGSDDCKEPWAYLLWMKGHLSFLIIQNGTVQHANDSYKQDSNKKVIASTFSDEPNTFTRTNYKLFGAIKSAFLAVIHHR